MGEIPFNVVCLSGQLHDPESVYQDPKWLGNAAALTAEFRRCRIHGDCMIVVACWAWDESCVGMSIGQ